MIRLIIGITMALSLTGCGLHQFQTGDPLLALEQSKEASKAACYQALARNSVDYSKLSETTIVMLEQQKSTLQMVGALTGKSMDPCSGGTNLNDVLIADSAQRNQTVRSVTGTAGGVVTTGIYAVGAVAAINAIGDNSGVRTYGDSSPATKTSTRTSTSSTASNAGDGSATTNPTGSVDPILTEPVITTEAAAPVTITP